MPRATPAQTSRRLRPLVIVMRMVGVLALVVAGAGCKGQRAAAPPEAVPQVIGAWQGEGSHTIGFVSHSGKFRVRWRAEALPGVEPGAFRLGVNSAVSGRPLDLPVDHQGPGEGVFNFEDDPRQYNLMVESSGLAWTIDVDEVVLVVR